MQTEQSRYLLKALESKDNSIVIRWKDNHISIFHHIWLRHQCECEICGSPIDGIRNNWLQNISANPKIQKIKQHPESIDIIWQDDEHRSSFSLRWLRDHCYASESRKARKHKPILWDASIAKNISCFDCKEITRNPEAHLDLLEHVRDYGFCKLENMDTNISGIEDVSHFFGPVRITHFGISELKEKSSQYNVGDSGLALLPHMDETYRISAVGITVFQMVNPSEKGGHSLLVDGFEVARRLHEIDPAAFDLLSKTPIDFKRHHKDDSETGEPRFLVSRTPIFKLDEDGDLIGARINERHISPLSVDEKLVEPFYQALRKLFEITYSPEVRITFPLKAGEGMVFDNQRLLHGRTKFIRGKSPRHARSCTVNTEEFHSTLRLLQIELGKPDYNKILYQGM